MVLYYYFASLSLVLLWLPCSEASSGVPYYFSLSVSRRTRHSRGFTLNNYEVGLENDQIFKSVLKSKWIKLIIFMVTFVIGLILFIGNKAGGSGTASAIIGMLFCWGLGFIGNFFEKNPDTRSVKAQAKDALLEVKYPVSTLVGKILGFFIMAVTSPIQIIALWIGITKVKKQIAENANVLNKFVAENTQQQNI